MIPTVIDNQQHRLAEVLQEVLDHCQGIDDLGLLDASVLGEVVHPRTFNTLRRIHDEDGSVLDEEEARAELAGPEVLLKELKAGVRWWTANLDNNTSTTGLSSGGIRCTSTKQSRSVGVFAPTHPTQSPPR